MKEPRRFAALRTSYRSYREAHMLIARVNKQLTQAGRRPTNEQLAAEQRAADNAKLARARLHAAISSAETPYSAAADRGMKALAWRYKAAFDAYHALVATQAKRVLAGDPPPSMVELLRQQEARAALAAAKRELEVFGPRACSSIR